MGLLKAGVGALSGVLADTWREYFYCEALDEQVLMAKGQNRTSKRGRSSNTKRDENVISNGSIVAVADGQCMLIVEQGKIVEVCAEPGEFVWDSSTQPSLFYGNLGEGIAQSFGELGKRFGFGGDAATDQRVYYINTKEILNNKYGTPTPVPFRVVDANIGLDLDTAARMNGVYSYRITDPLKFYKNVAGNVEDVFTRDKIDPQMKSEILNALQPALAQISAMGVRYSAVPAHTRELANLLNEEMSADWRDLRGVEIVSFGVNSIAISPEDEDTIKNLQRRAVMRDPNMRAAQASDALEAAAMNPGGAANGFMGMGMAMPMSMGVPGGNFGAVPPNAYGMAAGGGFAPAEPAPASAAAPAPAPAPAPAAGSWTCSCGAVNTGKFCMECGSPKPQPAPAAGSWTCTCGAVNTGKFCMECGSPRPQADASWTCSCGAVNTGKFCMECGSPRP